MSPEEGQGGWELERERERESESKREREVEKGRKVFQEKVEPVLIF